MTMGAVEQVAAQVGIPPEHVRRAAAELQADSGPGTAVAPRTPVAGRWSGARVPRWRRGSGAVRRTNGGTGWYWMPMSRGKFLRMPIPLLVEEIQDHLGIMGHASVLARDPDLEPGYPGGRDPAGGGVGEEQGGPDPDSGRGAVRDSGMAKAFYRSGSPIRRRGRRANRHGLRDCRRGDAGSHHSLHGGRSSIGGSWDHQVRGQYPPASTSRPFPAVGGYYGESGERASRPLGSVRPHHQIDAGGEQLPLDPLSVEGFTSLVTVSIRK